MPSSVIVDGLLPLAVPIDNLRPDPNNARRGDVASIRSSLNVFGQRKPIVVKLTGLDAVGRQCGIVIAGNHTYQAAVDLGWSEIAAVFVDDDASTARAYALADNRTGELATWDDDQLATTLRELSADSFDLTSLGWSNDELADLLNEQGDDQLDDDDVDEVPEPGEQVTNEGDVWCVGPHRIICGDATDSEVWRSLLDDDSDALTFTSPPYNLGATKSVRHGRTVYPLSGNQDTMTLDDWRDLVDSALGNALSYGPYAIFNLAMLTVNKVSILEWLYMRRKQLADVAIWHKPNPPPAIEPKVLNPGFEFLFIFGSGPHKNRKVEVATFGRGSLSNVHVGSVVMGNKFFEQHSATMPLHLPRWVIGNFTSPGQTVVDCFGGLGTTLLVADEMKRVAKLIEIEPRYVDVALARIQRVTGIVPTRAGVEHDFSGEA